MGCPFALSMLRVEADVTIFVKTNFTKHRGGVLFALYATILTETLSQSLVFDQLPGSTGLEVAVGEQSLELFVEVIH